MPESPWAKAGIAAGIVAAVAAVWALFPTPSLPPGNTSDVDGDNNTVIQCVNSGKGAQNCYLEYAEDATQKKQDRLIAEAEQYKDVEPAGPGPWPFIVVRTGELGLKIRNGTGTMDQQVGGMSDNNIAWVTCKTMSDFDPEPSTGVGPLWYGVKWPDNEPGTKFHNSEPAARYTQYAYGAYLLPLGHNGEVPECE